MASVEEQFELPEPTEPPHEILYFLRFLFERIKRNVDNIDLTIRTLLPDLRRTSPYPDRVTAIEQKLPKLKRDMIILFGQIVPDFHRIPIDQILHIIHDTPNIEQLYTNEIRTQIGQMLLRYKEMGEEILRATTLPQRVSNPRAAEDRPQPAPPQQTETSYPWHTYIDDTFVPSQQQASASPQAPNPRAAEDRPQQSPTPRTRRRPYFDESGFSYVDDPKDTLPQNLTERMKIPNDPTKTAEGNPSVFSRGNAEEHGKGGYPRKRTKNKKSQRTKNKKSQKRRTLKSKRKSTNRQRVF